MCEPLIAKPVPSVGQSRWIAVTRGVQGDGPRAFLSRAGAGPRGFWARGPRWVAHIGILDEIRVGAGAGSSERFQIVDRFRRGLRSDPGSGSVRLYGGFSFRVDDEPEPFWTAFPPARFIVPEAELEGGRSGSSDEELLLRVWARVAPGETPDRARRRAEERIEVLARATQEPRSSRSTSFPTSGGVALRTETDRGAWEAGAQAVLQAIAGKLAEKVVLARTLDVAPPFAVDPLEVLDHLRSENPSSHVFLFEPEPGQCLLGAAPETVATLRKGRFEATAVAGSIPRGETPEEQAFLARQLFSSRKDRSEHRYTVEEIVRRLEGRARDLTVEAEPHVLTLSRIQHLETLISAQPEAGETVLTLLEELHPTPAVCGLPRDEALAFLRKVEPFQRGWYAGPVGWVDSEGEGVFVPALRTAVSFEGVWRLFAGAGIVEESDPALEWEETRIKFQPVLRALAASGAP